MDSLLELMLEHQSEMNSDNSSVRNSETLMEHLTALQSDYWLVLLSAKQMVRQSVLSLDDQLAPSWDLMLAPMRDQRKDRLWDLLLDLWLDQL